MNLSEPLRGVKVVEFEGIGPGPMAGRMLMGMGASVTLIARPNASPVAAQLNGSQGNEIELGKQRIVLDLKSPQDREAAMRQVAEADVLIEGLRPGVMERLGFGPKDCARVNPKLVYGRMTGWGQTGPLAQAAGHDLNYVALSGLLSLSAHRGERPIVPPTVVGDASGALGLAFGIVCALLDARSTGTGRVVDAAIVDIVAMLGGIAQLVRVGGQLDCAGPSPFHDSPFYDVYECSDGRHITIGALEPQFYKLLLEKLGITDVDARAQYDTASWAALKQRIATQFKSRSRAEWDALLEGTDVCYAPVLSIAEAAQHPHNVTRGIYREGRFGGIFGAVAPRFVALDGDVQVPGAKRRAE